MTQASSAINVPLISHTVLPRRVEVILLGKPLNWARPEDERIKAILAEICEDYHLWKLSICSHAQTREPIVVPPNQGVMLPTRNLPVISACGPPIRGGADTLTMIASIRHPAERIIDHFLTQGRTARPERQIRVHFSLSWPQPLLPRYHQRIRNSLLELGVPDQNITADGVDVRERDENRREYFHQTQGQRGACNAVVVINR